MSVESFRQAQGVMRDLQSSEHFEHFGVESRGIRIQTESFLRGIAGISAANPDLIEPVTWIGALVQKVSEEYGTYVRVKGGDNALSVHMRGMSGPLSDDMSFEALGGVMLRRSGVEVDIYADGSNRIAANSTYLNLADGRKIADVINGEIKQLTDEQKERLAVGLITVVTQEVAQSGEFTDLA